MNTTPEIAQATADLVQSLAHLVQAIMADNTGLGIKNTDQNRRPTTEDCRQRPPVRFRKRQWTTEPIQPGDTSGVLPEFGRWADVQRLFGIKRGTLYNLLADGKVRSVLLRVRGQKAGVRLIHLESVRNYIYEHMQSQEDHE